MNPVNPSQVLLDSYWNVMKKNFVFEKGVREMQINADRMIKLNLTRNISWKVEDDSRL